MAKNGLLFTRSDCTFSAWMGAMAMVVVAMLLFAGYFGFFYKNAQAAQAPIESCEQYYQKANNLLDNAHRYSGHGSYTESAAWGVRYLTCREHNKR